MNPLGAAFLSVRVFLEQAINHKRSGDKSHCAEPEP